MPDSEIENLKTILRHVIYTYCPIHYADKQKAMDMINALESAKAGAPGQGDEE